MSSLAAHLREYMGVHGCAQKVVAERLQTQQQNVSRWLNGARPHPDHWEAIAELLGLTYGQVKQLAGPGQRRSRSDENLDTSSDRVDASRDEARTSELSTRRDLRSRENLLTENARLGQRVAELEVEVERLDASNITLRKIIDDMHEKYLGDRRSSS